MRNLQTEILNHYLHIFLQKGLIGSNQAQKIEMEMRMRKITWVEGLIQEKVLSPFQIAQVCAEHWNLPFYNLDDLTLSHIPKQIFEERFIKEHEILPLFFKAEKLCLAIADPEKLSLNNEIQFRFGLEISMFIVEHDKLTHILSSSLSQKIDNGSDERAVHQVTQILEQAIHLGASDIHFEPFKNSFNIRIRVDGILHSLMELSIDSAPQILSRLKILGSLDIAERRLPQDGRFNFEINSQKKDCRISTCPVLHGEKIVVRLLDGNKTLLNIDHLGLEEKQKEIFISYIKKPQGMILVTGPTGSGKTLTLYTALNLLNNSEKNISTVEDPIEIQLPGVNQVNINTKIGLTFSTILRAFLRQDPDIIMIGEIRDKETAEIAIKAAQTGHMVLSTLHTNSAAETLIRLVSMGINAYHIAHSINLIIAQRLLRKLCECKEVCKNCVKGYRGRIGVFECLLITEEIVKGILSGKTVRQLNDIAKQEGMLSMYEAALKKMELGLTNLDELQRVLVY